MLQEWFIIANPNSGSGATEEEWGYINNILSQKGISFRSEFTQRPFQAAEITQKALAKGYRHIIIAGGDGTYNEVINGIFQQKEVSTKAVTLAILPMGTGNDWVRTMKIPNDWEEAISLIENGKPSLQDVGCVNYFENEVPRERYFINVTGLGFDAFIAKNYLSTKKLGAISYFTALLKGLVKYQNIEVAFQVEGKERKEKIFTLAVALGQFFGAGMKIAPQAQTNDGLFDITLIKDIGKMGVVGQLANIYNGTFVKHPKVETFQCQQIRITSNEPAHLQMDGELIGHTPADFRIIPQSVHVLVPSSSK